MTAFVLAAILLCLLAVAFIAFPLLKSSQGAAGENSRAVSIRDVFRNQLKELDEELEQGRLEKDAYDAARAELGQRLQDELDALPATKASRNSAVLGWMTAVAVPVASLGIYLMTGEYTAVEAGKTGAGGVSIQTERTDVPPEVLNMVAGLEARLEQNPNDPDGWAMLGRSYAVLQNYQKSAEAYGEAVNRAEAPSSQLLTTYAEATLNANGGQFTAPVRIVLNQALAADPNDPKALWLAGQGAMMSEQPELAVRYWERLLALNPPEQVQDILRREIAAITGEAPSEPIAATEAAAETGSDTAQSLKLTVNVSLSADFQIPAEATLFVFAKIPDGPPMPLAVWRGNAGQLPTTITLDDSMGMIPSMKLSAQDRWEVVARVSPTGNATPSSGDWFGSALAESADAPISVVIDRQVP